MYKKFTLAELTSIQNNFISHLYKIIQQEKCQGINDFCKFAFKEGNELFYFDRGEVVFKIVLENNKLHFFDEKEKIEVEVPADQKGGLQDMIKSFIIHKGRQTGHTIKEILRAEFSKGTFAKMLDKPYLVYDIETSLIPDDKNLKNVEFYIGYYMEEKES
ncbi:MAG: hypothetical protein LBO09_08355 [Candidatus Peribacteria bacterium]|jgi:hypothetical protein|nr:hypothetical protein [Candidatus Peribacteria bacterium]